MIQVGSSEPFQLIEEELMKTKCKECKKEASNYFVFGNGFFCTKCFSKHKQGEAVQLLEFAKIIEKSIGTYKKDKANPSSALVVNSEEIKKKYECLKSKRDQLQGDLTTNKNKTLQRLEFLNQTCLDENTNFALEELYEPSLKVSSNMSITDILERNLEGLKISGQKEHENVCQFKEKDSKSINEVIDGEMSNIQKSLQELQKQSTTVMEGYYKALQELKK